MPCSSPMTRSPLALALLVLTSVLPAEPARAYRVVATDGRAIETGGLLGLGKSCRLVTPEGIVTLPTDGIDFYETFRANTTEGNVAVLASGGFLRFESVRFSSGRVTFRLAEGRSVTLAEAVLDFRASVLEASFVQLPPGRTGGISVAKATESPPPEREAEMEAERPEPTPERPVSTPVKLGSPRENPGSDSR